MKIQNLIYHVKKCSPLVVINAYQQLYFTLTKYKSLFVPVYVYSGVINDNPDNLKFAYLGWNKQIISHWLERIFTQYKRIPYKRLVPFWGINQFLKNNNINCNLAIVELSNKLIQQNVSSEKGFLLPRWLQMHMDVYLSLKIIDKQKDILRRIKKYGLNVEKGFSEQDFAFFYEKMHKPYVESRHKCSAIVENYRKMLYDFKKKNSTIYFIVQDGVRIAGLYEQNGNEGPHMYAVGIINGSHEIMKMGVIGALYYYALVDHMKNNINRVSIGGTSPLLMDGLTRYKLSLGAKISEMQHQKNLLLKLLPMKNVPALRNLLTSNPFFYFENESVYCAVFADDTKEESEMKFQKICSKTSASGVKETRIFCFNSHNKLSECKSDETKGNTMQIILRNPV